MLFRDICLFPPEVPHISAGNTTSSQLYLPGWLPRKWVYASGLAWWGVLLGTLHPCRATGVSSSSTLLSNQHSALPTGNSKVGCTQLPGSTVWKCAYNIPEANYWATCFCLGYKKYVQQDTNFADKQSHERKLNHVVGYGGTSSQPTSEEPEKEDCFKFHASLGHRDTE